MKPPPMAKPLTAAITGFSSAPDMNGSSMAGRRPPGAPLASDSFMSSPAQNARPAPVKIATSSSLLWRNSAQVSASRVRISWLSALSRSGRFMRTTRIWPWRSVSTTDMGGSPSAPGIVWAGYQRAADEQADGRACGRNALREYRRPLYVATFIRSTRGAAVTITTLSSREFNQDTSGAKKAAKKGPVFITDRGRPAHVLLTIEDYQRLTGAPVNIVDMLAMPGAADIDFEPPRLRGPLSLPADLS